MRQNNTQLSMTLPAARVLGSVLLVIAGLVGLGLDVDFSGWVLLAGLLVFSENL